ncbi:MAG: nitroreductase family protein [Olsenella sp.]
MTDFIQLAHDRYSCRKLSDRPVEVEKIDRALEAAIVAPTAVNRQPWHAWLITDPDIVARLDAVTPFTFGARQLVLFGAKADDAWERSYDGRNFADVDVTIAATHFMLEIADEGLGTTWVGKFDAPAMKELLPQTADYDLVALFPIGYPADDAEPSPRHFQRKPESDLVDRL